MKGSSTDTALGRIEAALKRIENASHQLTARSDDLGTRHARLKSSVLETLGDLDALLEATKP